MMYHIFTALIINLIIVQINCIMSLKITPIGEPLEVGTRPHYDKDTNLLYYVDVPEGKAYKYDPETKLINSVKISNDPIGFFFPVEGENTQFIAALGLKLVLVDWNGNCTSSGKTTILAEVTDNGRFNGGKVDPYGRLWAGTMGNPGSDGNVIPGQGCLYSLTKGKLKKHEENIGISNGLAWNVNRKKMYYIDTLITKVFAYDYDGIKGEITNKSAVFDFKSNGIEGAPDGLTIDTEGNLYVVSIFGSIIVKFSPVDGKILDKIVFPTPQVTAATWGGKKLNELYVTTARMIQNGSKPLDPAGRTFLVTGLSSIGVADTRYKK